MLPVLNAIYHAAPPKLRQSVFRGACRLIRPFSLGACVDGIHYRLDLGEMIDLALLLRKFEPHTMDAFRRLVEPGWTILDIGANIGAHSLPLARLTGPAGRVYAFEPADYGFRKLARNASLNGFPQLRLVKLALSNRNLPARQVMFQSSWPTLGPPTITPSTVEFQRLDDWAAGEDLRHAHLLKLDVDGHEYEVLDGGRDLLARFRPALLMETGLYHFAGPERNPILLLASLGYRFFDERTWSEYREPADIERMLEPAGGAEASTVNLIARVV